MHNPVSKVIRVPIEKVQANDYNPNVVPPIELDLLYKSIKQDGYTQPIVTYYDKDNDIYIIVDGFHRYTVSKRHKDILDGNGGLIPIVVIDKPLGDRMASTIRHNRARGRHATEGMVNVVYNLLLEGWSDEKICNELGMSAGELVRVKYISGYAKLYENVEYSKSWVPAVKEEAIAKRRKNDGNKEHTD